VRDNRDVLHSNVDRLTEVTDVLVKQRNALAEILDVAPAALGNLSLAYNGSSGTLDTRANINELTLPPIVLICEALRRGTPQNLPTALSDACSTLAPVVSGAVPLPSPADVITALQEGRPPPVPGLALPTVPAQPGSAQPGSAQPGGGG
jgi:ABC-type transporter Mla subunit MlaD